MTLVTRTVRNTGDPLVAPDGTALAGKTVTFTLVDAKGRPADVFDATTHEQVVGVKSTTTSPDGKKYGTERRRPRKCAINFPVLTLDESEAVHDLQNEVGTLGEVVLAPNPLDADRCQRFGGLGTLSELTPLDYPHYRGRATGFRWEKKL